MLYIVKMPESYKVTDEQIKEAMILVEVDPDDMDEFIPLTKGRLEEFKNDGIIEDYVYTNEFGIIKEIIKDYIFKTYHTGDSDLILNFYHISNKTEDYGRRKK